MSNVGLVCLMLALVLGGCAAAPKPPKEVRFDDLVRHDAAGVRVEERVLPEVVGVVKPAHTGDENPCVYLIYVTGEHRYTCPL